MSSIAPASRPISSGQTCCSQVGDDGQLAAVEGGVADAGDAVVGGQLQRDEVAARAGDDDPCLGELRHRQRPPSRCARTLPPRAARGPCDGAEKGRRRARGSGRGAWGKSGRETGWWTASRPGHRGRGADSRQRPASPNARCRRHADAAVRGFRVRRAPSAPVNESNASPLDGQCQSADLALATAPWSRGPFFWTFRHALAQLSAASTEARAPGADGAGAVAAALARRARAARRAWSR